ncbi:MAG: DNA repair protein RecN [Gammaproteobacteria bacterium]|nr:MAG: DNA repair protein RecN [Gammaproteobacteria bacterium]
MLESLYIKNFAIIDEQHVPFSPGFNVLSGETGAGKSILIGALGLQLGDRAGSSWIRHGQMRCNIQSEYRVDADSQARHWLQINEFDDESLCQLRRTLSANGQSRCYINGIPTTVGNTKQLGEMLVDIHGQHAHQLLLRPDKQLNLLDHFAHNRGLRNEVKQAYQHWQQLIKQKAQLLNDDNLDEKRELLTYQLAELDNLSLVEDEFDTLAAKQKTLASAQERLISVKYIDDAISGENGLVGGLIDGLNDVIQTAIDLAKLDEQAQDIGELLNQSLIYLEEAQASLTRYAQSITMDPHALAEVEERMSKLHQLARKHRVRPQALSKLHSRLQRALSAIDDALLQLQSIDADIYHAEKRYFDKAGQLSELRRQQAKQLETAVNCRLSELHLDNARFSIDFAAGSKAKLSGIDHITFLFSANPGQAQQPLHKVASGGELSRISLAIQVAGISKQSDMTLIFDEVDSGIGGATAEVVGRLLKTLSQYQQIICVTHLAQVAAFADRHIVIGKSSSNRETRTHFDILDDQSRINELARMSGGIKMDKKTLEHAKNLRDNAVQFSDYLAKQRMKHNETL